MMYQSIELRFSITFQMLCILFFFIKAPSFIKAIILVVFAYAFHSVCIIVRYTHENTNTATGFKIKLFPRHVSQ